MIMGKTSNIMVGLQAELVRLTGILQPTVSRILAGKRRATVEQAAELEAALVSKGIYVTRWDMLYSPKGTALRDIIKQRLGKKGA